GARCKPPAHFSGPKMPSGKRYMRKGVGRAYVLCAFFVKVHIIRMNNLSKGRSQMKSVKLRKKAVLTSAVVVPLAVPAVFVCDAGACPLPTRQASARPWHSETKACSS